MSGPANHLANHRLLMLQENLKYYKQHNILNILINKIVEESVIYLSEL